MAKPKSWPKDPYSAPSSSDLLMTNNREQSVPRKSAADAVNTSGSTPYTPAQEANIAAALSTRLHANAVSQRSGAGIGGSVMYIEGWKVIEIANNIFGFNGWSSQIVQQHLDFMDLMNDKWSVGVYCTVRVTLKDGSFREDNGYGLSENMRSKGQAYEKARKEASTDALKRTLRLFGHALGNCLSDKEYVKVLAYPGKAANYAHAYPAHRANYQPPSHASYATPVVATVVATTGGTAIKAEHNAQKGVQVGMVHSHTYTASSSNHRGTVPGSHVQQSTSHEVTNVYLDRTEDAGMDWS